MSACPLRIGVFGHGDGGVAYMTPSSREWIEAFGRVVAGNGSTLLTGGSGGVRKFARIGALSARGNVILIHPDSKAVSRTDDSLALGSVIASEQGKLGRVHLLVQSIDVGFSLGGGTGTLIEVVACYLAGIPTVVVDGLRGPRDPDPFALACEVSEEVSNGVLVRRGYLDDKDRAVVTPITMFPMDAGPEAALKLGISLVEDS